MEFCFRKIFPRTPKFFIKTILNYFIGNYLSKELDEDQIEIIDNHAQCSNIIINIKVVNDSFVKQNIPLNLLYGYIGCIRIYVPPKDQDGKLIFEISDLELSFGPESRSATPDTNLVFGSMVDSMVNLKRGIQDDDLIFEEKNTGKNFNALISKWISKLSLRFYNTKIGFESRPITQIDRCCRFLCEIEKIDFTTRESDNWNSSSTNLMGILLRNNIEFSGFSVRWEVAVQSRDETSEMASMCHLSNVILYGCQILSISNRVKVNYILLLTNSEPEFEINFNIDTVHLLLAPLPIHWMEILVSQITVEDDDSSISKNVKMTQSQYESFFPIEERSTTSYKTLNQDSIYYDAASIVETSSIINTYDDVSLDNSDEDDQCSESLKDSATYASLGSNISLFNDDGKMNTNFKASMSVKCFSMKILLQNPSNDFDFWDFKNDPINQTQKHEQWNNLSTKFFGLLKIEDKDKDLIEYINNFHKESGDIDFLSFILTNFMCSSLTKKCNEKMHRTFLLSTDSLKISEIIYQNFNFTKDNDNLEILSISSVNELNKAIDLKIEYNILKKELSFVVSVGNCYIGIDISLQDRIKLLTQNDMLDYNISEKNNSYETNKTTESGFDCIAVVKIEELCMNVHIPIVNLNNEMYSKSYLKYRFLHPESLQLKMYKSCFMYRTISENNYKYNRVRDYQGNIELTTNSILVYFTSTGKSMPILNIVNDPINEFPMILIKIKSQVSNQISDDQSVSSINDDSFPYKNSQFSKETHKPYSTKESVRNNSTNKFVHTPSDNEKINQYIKNAIKNSYFDIDIRASFCLILIKDKNILEVIYHRLAFDLLLWESNYDKRSNDVIIHCKSKDPCDTDEEANTDTSYEEESSFTKFRGSIKSLSKKFTLNMKIDLCRFYCQTFSTQMSDSIIELNQVSLFTDSEVVQGLIETQSIFITRIEKIKIFYSDGLRIDNQSDMQKLLNRNLILNENYFCVIDEVPESLISPSQGNQSPYMVVLIMDSQLTQLKKPRNNMKSKQKSSTMLTAQINRFCLRHNYIFDVNSGFGWLISLTDLLSLNNPVITGYVVPDSDTTMHLYASNCALDFCFSHFPMGSIAIFSRIELEMISNVTEAYHLNVELSFIGSQVYIRCNDNSQLSNYFAWNNENWFPLSLIDHGYCYVADLGNLDLKFQKIGSTNSTDKEPICNLEITNTEISVHLCADSLNLIVNCFSLLFSASPDPIPEETNLPMGSFHSRRQNSETNISQAKPQMLLNESDTTQLNHMIYDAMKDNEVSIQMKNTDDDELVDGFLVIDDISPNVHNRVISLENSPNQKLSIVYDHYKIRSLEDNCVKTKNSIFKDPEGFPISHNSMVFHDFSISIHFYAGTDLDEKCRIPQNIGVVKSNVRLKMFPPVKFQRFGPGHLSQINIQTADFDAYFGEKDKNQMFRGGANRKQNESYQWKMKKINFRYALFSNVNWINTIHQQVSRRLVFTINEIEVLSRNINSKINMVLFCDSNAAYWYDPKSPVVSFKMVFVQSNPNHDVVSEECDIKLSVQPIMLNLDQDFILFIEKFYKDLNTKDLKNNSSDTRNRQNSSSSALSESPHQEKDSILIPPNKNINKELILGRGGGMDSIAGSSPLSRLSTVRLPAFDEIKDKVKKEVENHHPVESAKSFSSIFIRSFSLYPDIYIRLDYTGTRLDLTQGALKGLLYLLIQLNNVILIIKNKQYLEGITGFDTLLQILTKEIYDEFILQINKIVTKIGPISEISEMLSGIYDLFSLPYQYYYNERGFIEGIKLGTRSITTTSLWATLRLLSKGLRVFQKIAETTYDFVSPSSSFHDDEFQQCARDLREGMTNAASGVRRRFHSTAHDMQLALNRSNRPMFGRMGDVIRQVPPAFAGPLVATCEASGQLIDGFLYQLKPHMKIEDDKKWKH